VRRAEAEARAVVRERWLSADGNRLLLRGNLERLEGDAYREELLTVDVAARFKADAVPWLFAGLAGSFGQNTNLDSGKGEAVADCCPPSASTSSPCRRPAAAAGRS